MVSFTLRGHRGDQLATITWTDGHLSGDPVAIAVILRIAQTEEDGLMGPAGGPYSTHRHLDRVSVAYELIRMVSARGYGELIAGRLPPLHAHLPPGAIP